MTRIALALIISALVACAAPAQAVPSPAAVRGGTIVVTAQEPLTLDPVRSTGSAADAQAQRLLFGGLLQLDPDGRWVPWLAERVPTLENGDVWLEAGGQRVRYRLRSGLAWSDGVAVTSADIRFTWERILADPRASGREGYDQIDGVETPDDRTAVVRYRVPYAAFASRFGALVPRHVLNGASEAVLAAFGRSPIGSGPFRLVEWRSGDQLIVVPAPTRSGEPAPYVDRIVLRFVASLEAAKAQLRAGEAHVAASLGESDIEELEGVPGIVLDLRPSTLVESLSFNVAGPITGDVAVRRALTLATPRDAIVSQLLKGRARPGTSELPLGWAAPRDARPQPTDAEKARGMLDAAGWRQGPDGIRSRSGTRLRLVLTSTTGNRLREQVEQVIADAWRTIGVETEIRNVPSATLTGGFAANGIRKRGTFDVVLAQLGIAPGDDPQSYLSSRHRCDAIPRAENGGAGSNWERWCDTETDILLGRAAVTLGEAERAALYARVLSRMDEAAIAVWLYDRTRIDAFRSEVRGHVGNAWVPVTADAERWWLAPRP